MTLATTLADALQRFGWYLVELSQRISPMTQSRYAIYLAIPINPLAIAGANAFFQGQFLRDASDEYSPHIGPDDLEIADTHRFCGDNFSAEELALLRPWISPGGEGYTLGVRARLSYFPALESTTNPPPNGKVLVTVLGAGAPYPSTQEEWETVRVSKARFFEEVAESIPYAGAVVERIPPLLPNQVANTGGCHAAS